MKSTMRSMAVQVVEGYELGKIAFADRKSDVAPREWQAMKRYGFGLGHTFAKREWTRLQSDLAAITGAAGEQV